MAQGAAAAERHRRQGRPKPSKALRDGLRLWMFEEVRMSLICALNEANCFPIHLRGCT